MIRDLTLSPLESLKKQIIFSDINSYINTVSLIISFENWKQGVCSQKYSFSRVFWKENTVSYIYEKLNYFLKLDYRSAQILPRQNVVLYQMSSRPDVVLVQMLGRTQMLAKHTFTKHFYCVKYNNFSSIFYNFPDYFR